MVAQTVAQVPGEEIGEEGLKRKIRYVLDQLSGAADQFANPKPRTIAHLIFEDEDQVEDIRASIREIRAGVAKLNNPTSVLGSLLAEDSETARQLETVIAALSDPQGGTLGRLINDDTIVRDLESMLMEFREAGRISRENAPLGSLISFTALFFTILN